VQSTRFGQGRMVQNQATNQVHNRGRDASQDVYLDDVQHRQWQHAFAGGSVPEVLIRLARRELAVGCCRRHSHHQRLEDADLRGKASGTFASLVGSICTWLSFRTET